MSDSPPPSRTPWDLASELHQQGLSRAQVLVRLGELGVDGEAAQVVLNALPSAPQVSVLPEANFELTTNPLAPSMMSVMDLGLEGERRTVALYWLTFGFIFAGLVTVALFAASANVIDLSQTPWGQFAVRALPYVGYPVALLALARGASLLRR